MNSLPHASGIYRITCTANGKVYVGSAVDLRQRWHTHQSDLRLGKHRNSPLQRAWNKYGHDVFVFEVLELVSTEHLLEREQWYLDAIRPYDRSVGFNILPTAGSRLGSRQPPEAIEKTRLANLGRKQPLEAVERHRQNMLGRIITWGEKIAAAKRGKPRDAETRRRLSAANTGKKHPPSHYEKHIKLWTITFPDGKERTISNLAAFCREHGLSEGHMRSVAHGRRKQHKGYRCHECV